MESRAERRMPALTGIDIFGNKPCAGSEEAVGRCAESADSGAHHRPDLLGPYEYMFKRTAKSAALVSIKSVEFCVLGVVGCLSRETVLAQTLFLLF